MEDEFYKETFVCMRCRKEFTSKEGTWPQMNFGQTNIEEDNEYMLNADFNDRSRDEFICYDCLD